MPPATFTNSVRVALHVGGGIAVVTALVGLAGLAIRTGQIRRSPMVLAALWWTVAPFTILAALDIVRPVLVARYALVSLPVAAVAFGVVVTRAGAGRWGVAVRLSAVVAVVAAVVTSAWQITRPWKYEDYRAAASFAVGTVGHGTPVLFAPSSARLGFDLYAPRSYLRDVALPSGVGGDPLAIAESPATLVQKAVTESCTAVVVGNPPLATMANGPESDRAKLTTVAGWTVGASRQFGQVAVTVVHNPACGSAAASREAVGSVSERSVRRDAEQPVHGRELVSPSP